MSSAGVIADRVILGTTWTVVQCPESGVKAAADDLFGWLSFLLGDEGASAHRIGGSDGLGLLSEVQRLASVDVGVFAGLSELTDADLRLLDEGRERLVDGARLVLVATPLAAARLKTLAPNLWSWMGSRHPDDWEPPVDPSATEARLAELRDDSRLSDAEVTGMASAGTLPADPDTAERLVLLGREDLLEG